VLAARSALARWFRRRIGGYTGDCLGAAQQVCEVVFYLTVLGLT
jgi:adenosylcobinamide-GDP ribazoletransferase